VASINRVVLVGNLTRDPDVRSLPSGKSVVELGIAVNHRYKNQTTDQWVEEPNYFTIVVFGAQGEACAQYLSKGRPVAVDGRLRWSSWEDKNGGGKRSKIDVIADTVQFLGSRGDDSGQSGQANQANQGNQDQGNQGFATSSDIPADNSDFSEPVGASAGNGADNDDIPF
jgi:single-strand DNA-binding protein